MRRLIAGLIALFALVAPAMAQGCGNSNPNCIVPNRPAGDSTNAAANTRFVTGAGFATFPTPTRAGDIIYWNGSIWTNLAGNNSGTLFLQETSAGVPSWASFSLAAPTYQILTSGSSATYTPTSGTVRIKVRMCGGGGGGGAASTNAGSNGGDTSFGTWTAIHGNGAAAGNASNASGGAGGTGGVNGTGTRITRVSGAGGNMSLGASGVSGSGGNSAFGGAGRALAHGGGSVAGDPAAANSCSGGGGANVSGVGSAPGGGAGEYVEFTVSSPSATTYTIGAGGNGGAAGSKAGGNGGGGIILIEEFAY